MPLGHSALVASQPSPTSLSLSLCRTAERNPDSARLSPAIFREKEKREGRRRKRAGELEGKRDSTAPKGWAARDDGKRGRGWRRARGQRQRLRRAPKAKTQVSPPHTPDADGWSEHREDGDFPRAARVRCVRFRASVIWTPVDSSFLPESKSDG